MEKRKEKGILAERKVFHRLLEVCCPRLKSAGQVSTPRREFAVVLRVVLEETAHTGHVHSSALFKGVMRTHTIFTRFFVLCFEFFCRELGEVVIVKRVPGRLRGGVHITTRPKPARSSSALIRSSVSDI